RIAKAYYERAADKRAAIAEILGVTDFKGFLERSGYEETVSREAGG
ncbi:MAG: lytic murein transglycosylase, partial [Gemmatimonadetes bacterium]|nr:lytic murein transglycosylase [Gemmatimonadota bacterium]